MTQADVSDDEQMKHEQSSDEGGVADADAKASHGHTSQGHGAPLESEVQGKLGEKLREAYSEVIDAPVPDRFLDLLAQLDAKSAASSSNEGDDA